MRTVCFTTSCSSSQGMGLDQVLEEVETAPRPSLPRPPFITGEIACDLAQHPRLLGQPAKGGGPC